MFRKGFFDLRQQNNVKIRVNADFIRRLQWLSIFGGIVMFDITLSTNEPSPRLVVLYITEGDKEDYNLVGDIPHASFKWLAIFPVLPPVHTWQSSRAAFP